MLLGGDLFHDNKPSRTTLVRAMEILSKYCLKPKPIAFKVLSDEARAFVSGYACFLPPQPLTSVSHQRSASSASFKDALHGVSTAEVESVVTLTKYATSV